MTSQSQLSNALLRSLPASFFYDIDSLLEPVDLPLRLKLSEPGKECNSIYFPESGVASIMSRVGKDWQEIGLFGREGAGCLSRMLGNSSAPYLTVVQVPGKGHRLPLAVMIEAFRDNEEIRALFMRYVQAFLVQVSQSAIANTQYNTVQRMAHWFLMIHDRVEGDSIHLTHEYIASMLGVGRTGVTLALHVLESGGMISTARKRINILDREALEQMTASVYGIAEAEYRKLMGPLTLPHSSLSGRPRHSLPPASHFSLPA